MPKNIYYFKKLGENRTLMSTLKLKVTKKSSKKPNREAILKQLETDNLSVKELAKKEGLSISTLYKWRNEQKDIKGKKASNKKVKLKKSLEVEEKAQTKPKYDKQNRNSYTEDQQEAILKKLKTQNLTFKELAKKERIGTSTLYTWQKNARERAAKVGVEVDVKAKEKVKVAKKKTSEKIKKIVANPIDQVMAKVKVEIASENDVKVKTKKVKINVKESAFLTAWETLFATFFVKDCEKMGISSDSISILVKKIHEVLAHIEKECPNVKNLEAELQRKEKALIEASTLLMETRFKAQ